MVYNYEAHMGFVQIPLCNLSMVGVCFSHFFLLICLYYFLLLSGTGNLYIIRVLRFPRQPYDHILELVLCSVFCFERLVPNFTLHLILTAATM